MKWLKNLFCEHNYKQVSAEEHTEWIFTNYQKDKDGNIQYKEAYYPSFGYIREPIELGRNKTVGYNITFLCQKCLGKKSVYIKGEIIYPINNNVDSSENSTLT